MLVVLLAAGACRSGSQPSGREGSAQQDDPEADRAMLEGRWSESAELHRRLLEGDPENGLALYHLGYSLGSLGDHRQEAVSYERALRAGYASPDLLYNLGLARLALGELAPAGRALDEALAARPDEAEFHHAAGRVALARGRDGEARRHLERTVALDSGHREAWAALAELYERGGDPRAATRARERAAGS